jgi:hypothetical protein
MINAAIDENNLRYFFSTSIPLGSTQEMLDFNFKLTVDAFTEDKKMIEGQQLVILNNPNDRLAATTHDKAALYFRKLVKQASNISKTD